MKRTAVIRRYFEPNVQSVEKHPMAFRQLSTHG